ADVTDRGVEGERERGVGSDRPGAAQTSARRIDPGTVDGQIAALPQTKLDDAPLDLEPAQRAPVERERYRGNRIGLRADGADARRAGQAAVRGVRRKPHPGKNRG